MDEHVGEYLPMDIAVETRVAKQRVSAEYIKLDQPTPYRIKFHGGVLHGRTHDLTAETPRVILYGYEYEATGRRDGDHWVYVRVPRSSKLKQFLKLVMTMTGKDPRLNEIRQPVQSTRRGRNVPCRCGSGLKYKKCHGRVA